MHFSFVFIKNSVVFKAYLILQFIQKHVLPCWEQWLWGPGYGGTMEALVHLHFMRKVLLMQWGVCWNTIGTPWSPLALCFFLTGLTQGGSLGAGQQSPGRVCASLLLLGSQWGICHHPSGCDSTAVYGLLVGAIIQTPKRLCTPKVLNCWKITFVLLLSPIGTEVW